MQFRPRKHSRWTPDEDAELRRRCEAGEYLIDIAKFMGRSQEGLRTRCNVLGIPCRSARSKFSPRTVALS